MTTKPELRRYYTNMRYISLQERTGMADPQRNGDTAFVLASDADARISALEAQLVEAQKDAARYRWLRNEGSHMGIIEWRTVDADYQNLEQLDTAIDAAITASADGGEK